MLGTRAFLWHGSLMGQLGWWGISLRVIAGLIILALVGWLIYVLAKGRPISAQSSTSEPESAFEIVKRRYARGEITQAEFEQYRRDLTSDTSKA